MKGSPANPGRFNAVAESGLDGSPHHQVHRDLQPFGEFVLEGDEGEEVRPLGERDEEVQVGVPKDATNEQRLAALERRVDEIETFAREREKKRKEELADLRKRIASEESERKREDSALHERIEEAMIGGLRLEHAGLIWLVFGVVMSAAPQLVAWIIRPVYVMLPFG